MKNKIKMLLKNSKLFMWGYNVLFMYGYKKYMNRDRQIYTKNKKLFENETGIEIGGPSPVFSEEGPIPFYKIVKRLDNNNYRDKTFWGKIDEGENFQFNKNKPNGKQFIADATDLSIISDNFYDFILASHIIEHIANPIKALYEWKRIIKPGGYIAIIAPHMQYTFDRRRPLTNLDHIINDYKHNTQESDNTHFKEVIDLHDVPNDSTVASYEDHVKRTLDNINTRIVHQHTFDMNLLIELLNYCDFKIIDAQFFKPYHIMVIAQKR